MDIWEEKPKVNESKKKRRKFTSFYRLDKLAPHITKGGVGLVGQLMGKQRKRKKNK